MESECKRFVTDFVVGSYSEAEIQDSNFMRTEEKRAHEELKHWGYEYVFTKPDSFVNGEYVRVFRIYKAR
ncbi:hypothetical protein FLW98_26820 [Raoultella planticola]|nr:hypothetical protein FLW98_26820 [Raoultella planticola]